MSAGESSTRASARRRPLAAGKAEAALAQPGLQLVGQGAHDVAELRGIQGGPERLLIRIGPRQQQVGADRIVEKMRLLGEQRDARAELGRLEAWQYPLRRAARARLRARRAGGRAPPASICPSLRARGWPRASQAAPPSSSHRGRVGRSACQRKRTALGSVMSCRAAGRTGVAGSGAMIGPVAASRTRRAPAAA